MEHLASARLCAKHLTHISFNPLTQPSGRFYHCPHFTDEETELNPDLTSYALCIIIIIIHIFQNIV